MCIICEIRAELDRQSGEEAAATAPSYNTGEAQSSSDVGLDEAHGRAQVNLMRATAIQKMTRSIRDLGDMGLQDLSKSVRRMLERMLSAEPIPEPPAQPADASDADIPDEVSAVAKALAEELGMEVKVVRFPKK